MLRLSSASFFNIIQFLILIDDFNKMFGDFNGYLNKLTQENKELKERLILAKTEVKTKDDQLLVHQKSNKELESNISKKLQFNQTLKSNFEILQSQHQASQKENAHLKEQIREAKRVLMQIQATTEEKVKETLQKNYLDWKNKEKAKILEVKQSVDKQVEERLHLEKEALYQKFKTKLGTVKLMFEKKESEIKQFYESQLTNQKSLLEKKFKAYMEDQINKINLVVTERIHEYKNVGILYNSFV